MAVGVAAVGAEAELLEVVEAVVVDIAERALAAARVGLERVAEPISIRVLAFRIAAVVELETVGEAVAVAIGVERVGTDGVDFATVVESVPVRVGVVGVGAELVDLLTVRQAVTVAVDRRRGRWWWSWLMSTSRTPSRGVNGLVPGAGGWRDQRDRATNGSDRLNVQ